MLHDFDALIVGAGPAGCAAAYDLAHAGRRVLLLDKRSFPRAKACACGLTRKTLKALRYSVEPVLERECRDVVLQEAGPAFLHGRRSADKACEIRVHLRQPFCAMAVRSRFDHFCLEQTLAAGRDGGSAQFLRIDTLLALRELPSGVELDIALPDGSTQTLSAPALIGADGSNGQTRRLSTQGGATAAQLPPEPSWYARGFALEATVPYGLLPEILPAGDHPHDLVFDFAPIAGGYGWLFPKADHINIGVGGFVPQKPGAPTGSEQASTGDPAMVYETVTRALLDTYIREKLGLDLASLPGTHVTGQHLGLGGHAYIPHGRILLTGDAAGLVDPLTGEGIHSAITSGQAAAAAILEALPQTLSSRPKRSVVERPALSSAESQASQGATHLAAAYARHLKPLQETLAFSHRAARSFYREPERGFKVMRTPLLRNLVLKTYADGLPTTKLLASLARRVA
ncbi:MAG TPA: FAD-dependent oxidoreductase [Acidobacteriaceae bacterium]|nr:FAD-dependent oxidoreductase [Acidobacteriaceae bacterium]